MPPDTLDTVNGLLTVFAVRPGLAGPLYAVTKKDMQADPGQ